MLLLLPGLLFASQANSHLSCRSKGVLPTPSAKVKVLVLTSNFCLLVFKEFLFYIGIELMNNLTLVSGVQQSDSVICLLVCILFQILCPFRLF